VDVIEIKQVSRERSAGTSSSSESQAYPRTEELHVEPRSDLLRDRLERAIRNGGSKTQRLLAAGISVSFQVTGHPDQSVSVLLDRDPPQVLGNDEPTEITFVLTQEQAVQFARGRFRLPNALMAGKISAIGPVRKYLVIDPVVRSILSALDTTELR
jgi:hypothetical protein